MKALDNLKNRVLAATDVVKLNFPVADVVEKIEADADVLLGRITKDNFIKIPFVGDFSSGKSSLLNAYIGSDLLPTNILPETAVAYELYYAEDEKLELYSDGVLKETKNSLSQIKDFNVSPGDVVYVYINNEKIRSLNSRGIVLVDMPGIDSGIEAHNSAILNYIREGSVFMIFTDTEQATLRSSTISFIREIQQYGLSINVFLSKADKKPETEVQEIRASVEKVVKSLMSDDSVVGVTSSVEEKYGYKDVEAVLSKVDAEKIFAERYTGEVDAFISSVIAQFEMQIKLITSNAKDFDSLIEQLSKKKTEAISSLEGKVSQAQSLEGSADDILQDIRSALMGASQRLAMVAFSSKGDGKAFESELMSIIRPVLINSFKREMTEYQEVIGESMKELSADLSSVISVSSTQGESLAKDVLEKFGGGNMVESLLQKGLSMLLAKFAGKKALTLLVGALSPVITIVVSFLPDLISLIFGKSNEQKTAEVRDKIESQVIGRVIDGLRPNVERMLMENRQEAYNEIKVEIENTIEQIDENIKSVMDEKLSSEAEISERVNKLALAVEELKKI
ncbi:MAG: dynamin family protein [Paludibacteraceae bacterium]|nr:dynamin family protein [Paludibacteraceae bacterium]